MKTLVCCDSGALEGDCHPPMVSSILGAALPLQRLSEARPSPRQETLLAGVFFPNSATTTNTIMIAINNQQTTKVVHNSNDDEFQLVGAKVGSVRASLVDAFNIPVAALAFIDGVKVDYGHRLRGGETLEFCVQWGRKGAGPKPPIKWYGSKWRLMPKLIPLYPAHKLYVTVFGGSAPDILRKEPSEAEVFNDLNGNLSNFFSVLQNPNDLMRLQQKLAVTPYSRTQFEICIQIIQDGTSDTVERAWAFATAANQIRNGLDPGIALPSWWSSSVDQKRLKWLLLPEQLQSISDRFRSVVIENKSWVNIICPKGKGGYDSDDTFFFLDPSYLSETRESASRRRYQLEMSEADHEHLLQSLQNIKGTAMLCGYSSPLYERYLSGWRRQEFVVPCATSHAKKRPTRTECVWMNY